jgi:two-component system cell cycle response regulator
MPKMDGYEAAIRLRQDPLCCQVPIVGVTALAMVGDREKLLNAGFDGYISKPIEPESFVDKVQSFLRFPPSVQSAPAFAAPVIEEQRLEAPAGKRGVLLFVDNSPTNLELARSILAPHGYEVVTASTVEEGVEVARRTRPDLIVSDVHMPRKNGFDFIRLVQSEPDLGHTPFVFLSSTFLTVGECETGLGLGAAKFLCRPLDPQTLLDELEECLNNRQVG